MTEYKLDTLPKQLRIKSNMIYLGERIAFGSECELMDIAANEIECLLKERDRYREALEVIIAESESIDPTPGLIQHLAERVLEAEK